MVGFVGAKIWNNVMRLIARSRMMIGRINMYEF